MCYRRPTTTNRAGVDAMHLVRCGGALGAHAAIAAVVLAFAPAAATAASLIEELDWAYAIGQQTPAPAAPAAAAAAPVPAPDVMPRSLPGAAQTFTLDQIRNRFGPADWFPADHPSMPQVIATGREQAGIWACSLCHYPNGRGRPENAGVAGLARGYIVQQLEDFKNGLRGSADARKSNTALMAAFAHAMTEAEIAQAADYFSAIRWAPWIKVVESETAPKTRVQGGMYLTLDGAAAGTEPLGHRIVETPDDARFTEQLRNPHSGFTAYVPRGSIARGRALATSGAGRTTACKVCHGENLDGLALVPTLRGRSPSYIARQLADFKLGTRHGVWAPLMVPVVANLTADDIVSLSAYLASLPPGS